MNNSTGNDKTLKEVNPYSLILSGHYNRDPGLDKFIFALTHAIHGQVNEWTVTSSHANGQDRGDQHTRGGLLPQVHHVKDLKCWEVEIKPINLSHVKGIDGNFYKILPFEVTTIRGGKRSDFGVHLDANVPGSLGCIVMDRHNFNDYERTMEQIEKSTEFTTIPLYVFYS